MSEILFINACARENSRTLELAKHFLDKLDGKAEEVNLYKTQLEVLDAFGIKARDEAFRAKDFSDKRFDLARQFAEAKTIVVAAPYWDLMFPSVLKIYFESVTVNGLTFAYGENGIPVGLCNAERLIYITTSGGPIKKNFGYDYVLELAKSFYGIKELSFISAEGLDIRGADTDDIMNKAKSGRLGFSNSSAL